MSLWDNLERFFDKKVDLFTSSSIINPYLKKNIDSTKILIYDGKRQKYVSDILHALFMHKLTTHKILSSI